MNYHTTLNPTNPNLNYTTTNPYPPNYTYINNNPHNLTTTQHFNPNPYPNSFNSHEFYGGGGAGGGGSINPHQTVTVTAPFASGMNAYTYVHANNQYDQYSFQSDGGSGVTPTACYEDPNAQNWAMVMEAARQHGINPAAFGSRVTVPTNEPQQLTARLQAITSWPNATIPPSKTSKWKRLPKKTKIVQSLYCETCKVDCSSRVVYEGHVLGKKHKKNMEKLIPAAQALLNASTLSNLPVTGPQEKVAAAAVKAKNKTTTLEDLETKRRKVLDGGAAANAVRLCAICNVVCNSDLVFRHHLSGQKHAAMVNKSGMGTTL